MKAAFNAWKPVGFLLLVLLLGACIDEEENIQRPTTGNTNFEAGANGWNMTGLWRINNFRAVSAPNSANFSQGPAPGDFDVVTNPACPRSGQPCADGALSRAVDLTNITRLEFDYFLDGECGFLTSVATCIADALFVDVSTDMGATWTDQTGGNLVDTFDGITEAFQHFVIDLTPFTGTTVEIRFYFDSWDACCNLFRGANIDNIEFFQ